MRLLILIGKNFDEASTILDYGKVLHMLYNYTDEPEKQLNISKKYADLAMKWYSYVKKKPGVGFIAVMEDWNIQQVVDELGIIIDDVNCIYD